MSAPAGVVRCSCFPVRIDQGRGDGFAGRLAAPQDELEHGIEALALLDCRLGDCFGLLEAEAVTVEDCRVAEHHEPRP